jgi:hypothetical protein
MIAFSGSLRQASHISLRSATKYLLFRPADLAIVRATNSAKDEFILKSTECGRNYVVALASPNVNVEAAVNATCISRNHDALLTSAILRQKCKRRSIFSPNSQFPASRAEF